MRTLLALPLLCLLTAPAVMACAHPDSKSNVINKPCPELLLEREMIQGDRVTNESIKGKVVLFLYYQRDCEGSERTGMPRIQELYEKYKDHPCAKVFVINTAFDKDIYPVVADIAETRKHLLRMDWSMPVARDLDEKTNALFTIDGESGTPQAVVLNERGVVCAHEWYSEEDEMKRVDQRFETLAAGMNCRCERMPREVRQVCQRSRDYIEEGDYARAWDEAETICRSYGYDEADKKDAEYLQEWIQEVAKEKFDRVTEDFEVDPETAIVTAEELVKQFGGVTTAKDFAPKIKDWRKSDALVNFRNDRTALEKLTSEVSRAGDGLSGDRRKAVVERLQNIAERAPRSSVANEARTQLESLGEKVKPVGDVSSNPGGNNVSGSGGISSNRGGNASSGTSAAPVNGANRNPGAARSGGESNAGGDKSAAKNNRKRHVRQSR